MKKGTGILVSLCISLGASAALASEKAEEDALQAAEAWLTLVDAGRNGESWSQAASLFRKAVSQPDWEKAVSAARGPLGRLLSRSVKSRTYTETLPGAPDGQYVVIQYESSFEKKRSAIETVTPMLDEDGVWRVSGYYIK